MNQVKAPDADSRCGKIVVSFDAKWAKILPEKRISLVIRKRVPTSGDAEWLYAYVSTPEKRILLRARIRSICHMTADQLLPSQEKLGLSAEEIRKYVGIGNTVGVYEIDQRELASGRASLADLSARFGFTAPQSFFFVNRELEREFDGELGFRRTNAKRKK